MKRRLTFAVGRVDRKTTELRVVERSGRLPSPVTGPFSVAAVVRTTSRKTDEGS